MATVNTIWVSLLLLPLLQSIQCFHFMSCQHRVASSLFSNGFNNMESNARPRLIVFDLDGCLWKPEMYELAWRGMNHAPFDYINIRDKTRMKSQLNSVVQLIGDVAVIIDELVLDRTVQLAISSRCDEPMWARELLGKMTLPVSGMTLEEAITGPWEISFDAKIHHFDRIAKQTGIQLEDMVFFDNEQQNCKSVSRKGVTVGYTPNGVTRDIFEKTMSKFPCAWGVVGLEV